MSEITYDDKVDLQVATNIANINKVTASDMNEIKSAVNDNATDIATLETDKLDKESVVNEPSTETDEVYSSDYLNDKLVSVGATAPENGERVWFKKRKNLLPQNRYIASTTINGVTYTNNGDGTFSLVGTATANTTMVILPENNFQLEQGQAYYLYSNEAYNVDTFNLAIVMTEGSSTRFLTTNHTYTPTTTPISEKLQFYIVSGKSVNKTNIKVMLVKGNTAPSEYEPYVEEGIYVDEEEWYSPNNIEKYSTGEIKIGTWIDGKPLYRKVITFGALANNGNKTIPYGSSNNLIKFDIYAKNPTANYLFKVPLGGTNYINSYVDINSHQIVVQTNSDRTNVTDNYVIIEYTKT